MSDTIVVTKEDFISNLDKYLFKYIQKSTPEDIENAVTYDIGGLTPKWNRNFCNLRSHSFSKAGKELTGTTPIMGIRADCCALAGSLFKHYQKNINHNILLFYTPVAWLKGKPELLEEQLINPYVEWVRKIRYPLNYHGIYNIDAATYYGFNASSGVPETTRTKHPLCPSFVYSIYQDDIVSSHHSLATFTFFRYLQHPSYNKIPELWLKLLNNLSVHDDDLNPVECLALAHLAAGPGYEARTALFSTSTYWPYTQGLTDQKILQSFLTGSSINAAFVSEYSLSRQLDINENGLTCGYPLKTSWKNSHINLLNTQLTDLFKSYIQKEKYAELINAYRRLMNFIETPLDKLPNKLTINEFVQN